MSTNSADNKEPNIEEIRRFSNGCMIYFFLPVLLIGLGVIGWGYREGQSGADAYEYYFWGVLIAAVGGVPLAAYLVNRESLLVGIRLRQQFPKQPWMWREDWRTGIIPDCRRPSLVAAWVRAIFVTGVMFVLGRILWDAALEFLREYPWQTELLLAALCLVPVLLFGMAIYTTLQRQRFGASTLYLKKTPLQPGEHVTGRIETTLAEVPQEGAALRLTCLGFVTRGKQSRYEPVWTASTMTDSTRIIPGPAGVTIPVDIAIPEDAKTSAVGVPGTNYHWRLSAKASVSGIDFFAEFDLPVFRIGSDGRVTESNTV